MFFPDGVVNNGRDGSSISRKRSVYGIDVLLGKIGYCLLLSSSKGDMPCSFRYHMQSRAESLAMKDRG